VNSKKIWQILGGEEGEILRKVDFEIVNFRVRVSLALIPCRENRNPQKELIDNK